MSVTIGNIMQNHRGVYFEATGDGVTTALPVVLTSHYPGRNANGVAFVVTAPTSYTHKTGRGGFLFPEGSAQAVSSASISGSTLTVNTTAAIGNGVKAYVAFVFNETSVRG